MFGYMNMAISQFPIDLTSGTFQSIVIVWIVLGLTLAPIQLLHTAPFGRHFSASWGPSMDNRTGWVIMEIVSPIALWGSFFAAGASWSLPVMVLMCVWTAHYINRSIVYPMRIRTQGKRIPIAIVASAITFNCFNGWCNGIYFGAAWGGYTSDWLTDPRFFVGLFIMGCGAAVNLRADNVLLRLRSKSAKGYRIPRGGLFDKVSCPNFLGEIIEWTGFAIACWNLPALGFAVWTAANLVPRAISHHRFYKRNFDDYPEERRALVPGIL